MINEVVVTGLAGNSLMKDSPTPVSVLTAADIKSVSSTNIIDAIAHQPGISQITTGSGISKPVIRGLGYNRIVTVNDGKAFEENPSAQSLLEEGIKVVCGGHPLELLDENFELMVKK